MHRSVYLGLAFALAGCHQKSGDDASEVPFRTVEQGGRSAYVVPAEERVIVRVFTTQADFNDFWLRHQAGVVPFPTTPVFDFRSRTVIAALASARPAGGTALHVDRAFLSGRTVELEVTEGIPAPGCDPAMAGTQPFHIIDLDGIADAASIRKYTQAVAACAP